MELKKGEFCPLIKKDCIQLKCSWFTHVRGTDPNTGKEVDHYDCAMTWLPMLLVENSKEQRQTGAAVESFRNEMVRSNNLNIDMLKHQISNSNNIIINKNNN